MKISLIILVSILFIACVESKVMISYTWNVANFVPVNCSEKISWDDNINAISFDADDKLCTNRSEFILEKPETDSYTETRLNLTFWNKAKTNIVCNLSTKKYSLMCQIIGDNDIIQFPLQIADFYASQAHCSEPDNILSCTIELNIIYQQHNLRVFTCIGIICITLFGLMGIVCVINSYNYDRRRWDQPCYCIFPIIIVGLMILSNSALIFVVFYKWGLPTTWESYRIMLLLILLVGCPLINLFWIFMLYAPILFNKCKCLLRNKFCRQIDFETNPIFPLDCETNHPPLNSVDVENRHQTTNPPEKV